MCYAPRGLPQVCRAKDRVSTLVLRWLTQLQRHAILRSLSHPRARRIKRSRMEIWDRQLLGFSEHFVTRSLTRCSLNRNFVHRWKLFVYENHLRFSMWLFYDQHLSFYTQSYLGWYTMRSCGVPMLMHFCGCREHGNVVELIRPRGRQHSHTRERDDRSNNSLSLPPSLPPSLYLLFSHSD